MTIVTQIIDTPACKPKQNGPIGLIDWQTTMKQLVMMLIRQPEVHSPNRGEKYAEL